MKTGSWELAGTVVQTFCSAGGGIEGFLPDVRRHAEAVRGTVVRFNFAKHGQASGVVLDSGHFLHTRPDGLRRLGWRIGQNVKVKSHARQPL
jgi:hypothetical protein